MEIKRGKHYVNSTELEMWWQKWIDTKCEHAWEEMSDRIYQMCQGIATHFNPRDDEEHQEHVHDAFLSTMEKIRLGKLKFIRGKAPVFNLITTTVFRILYSKMNRIKKYKEHQKKYAYQFVQKHIPELLNSMEYPYVDQKNSLKKKHEVLTANR